MRPTFSASTARAQAASAVLALALATGCSRGESARERQIAQLRDELTRVQADHDRFEQRLNKLEIESADDRALETTRPPARSGAAPVATPSNLRVVRLSPDGPDPAPEPAPTALAGNGRSGDDPDDSTPRPSIRVQGTSAPRYAHGVRPADRVEQTLPPEDATAAAPSLRYAGSDKSARVAALDPDARRAYDAALALVTAKRYPQALDAFAAFLIKWPDHPNADNAMYWRGESYFAQGELARAAEQFEGLIARFPLGNKVPDSILKLGICQQRLGNPQIAKTHFDRLLREYPRSEAARRVPSLTESK
jgi:tol-pal system protein YbgF